MTRGGGLSFPTMEGTAKKFWRFQPKSSLTLPLRQPLSSQYGAGIEMLSIGEFAKLTKISTRAVRHYESLGLIRASVRGENNYRYFDRSQIGRIVRIRDLQGLGFSLEEVREILALGTSNMTERLKQKLVLLEGELSDLTDCRNRIKSLLSISLKIESSRMVPPNERKLYMEAIKIEVVNGLRARHGQVSDVQLQYLEREKNFYDAPEKQAFLEAVKKCIFFAREQNLTLGPGRGSCPASIVLYGLGFSGIDPTKYDLIPERLTTIPPDIHIDVEFDRGQRFVDFCRRASEGLSWGQINAFKMPLLDIINQVHHKLGAPIDYASIPDDSDLVLDNIRRGDIDKIFLFDYSPNALVMRYEGHLPGYEGTTKIKEYLKSQAIGSFRDVVNIISVWRPSEEGKIRRIERYRQAKVMPRKYEFLKPELQRLLAKNFGLIIYHEDAVEIIAAYTSWNYERSSKLRRAISLGLESSDLDLFKELVPQRVFDLVIEETPFAFCKPHAMSFAQFTKMTSILKSLHPQIYLDEIRRWEERNGLVWDDIGIKIRGVSLLQH